VTVTKPRVQQSADGHCWCVALPLLSSCSHGLRPPCRRRRSGSSGRCRSGLGTRCTGRLRTCPGPGAAGAEALRDRSPPGGGLRSTCCALACSGGHQVMAAGWDRSVAKPLRKDRYSARRLIARTHLVHPPLARLAYKALDASFIHKLQSLGPVLANQKVQAASWKRLLSVLPYTGLSIAGLRIVCWGMPGWAWSRPGELCYKLALAITCAGGRLLTRIAADQ
jgi:hypothetical protein